MNSDLSEKTIHKEIIYLCHSCGERLEEDDALIFEDRCYCEYCLNEFTVTCDCCGIRVDSDDAVSDSYNSLCQYCFDEYYCFCTECEAIIKNSSARYFDDEDEEYPYCSRCYEDKYRNALIHDYSYKPEPVFHGEGTRYFGVELEVDCGGCDNENADNILYTANYNNMDNLYIKKDGSLDEGMELVSHPMTLEYHKNTMPWESIMKTLINMGYRSHETSTCGLHCHVNRNSLGYTVYEQEKAIARILYFVEHHWSEMLKFSRRTEKQIRAWANRYGMKNNPTQFLEDVKSVGNNRYACINLNNYDTIEFRIFRGTLKYNSFIAALQFVDEICNAAVFMSDDCIADLSWLDFISGLNNEDHGELITYLKERSLYINEPVESEDDE